MKSRSPGWRPPRRRDQDRATSSCVGRAGRSDPRADGRLFLRGRRRVPGRHRQRRRPEPSGRAVAVLGSRRRGDPARDRHRQGRPHRRRGPGQPLGPRSAAGRRSARVLPRRGHDPPCRRPDRQEDRAGRGARCLGGRRGRPARHSPLPGLRVGPHGLRVLHLRLGQPRRPHAPRRGEARGRTARRPRHDLQGHPQGVRPQRRPYRLRPGQDALRRHGRERRGGPVPGRGLHGRQDPPPDPGGRTGPGQPVPGLPGVLVRPPQRCADPGLAC
ncbi:hypothetical protein SGLAM104S_01937 [Streptomyces glaucescens]